MKIKHIFNKKAQIEETKTEKEVDFFLIALFIIITLLVLYFIYWAITSGKIQAIGKAFQVI
jgi:hypothetical protein